MALQSMKPGTNIGYAQLRALSLQPPPIAGDDKLGNLWEQVHANAVARQIAARRAADEAWARTLRGGVFSLRHH